jgi:RNA polymerase sigma-B factor
MTLTTSTRKTSAGAGKFAGKTDEELFRNLTAARPREREAIREALVARHAGLVRWLAGQYANPSVNADELRQVGYLGLVLAMERFDVDRGADFVSFARPTVQGEIRRWFRDKRRWVRLPRRLQEARACLREAGEVLTHQLGRAPSTAELARHTGLPDELVAEALAADDNFTTASLDAAVGHDGDETFTLADTIGDDDPAVDLLVNCTALSPLVADLDERDRRVLHLRFYQDKTQSQIGAELGCSQMQVSRMLSRILGRLRTGLLADEPAG